MDANAQQALTGKHPITEDLIVLEEDEPYITVQNILIIGNDKTKENIILREIGFEPGDIILRRDLEKIIENDKSKLINTRLFLSVDFTIVNVSLDLVDVLIEVSERWYLFPVPIFKIESRNFNDWWVNQNHDFDRVSYGIKFYQYNSRGRNEKLKLQAQFGFTKSFEIQYEVPYFDKIQRNGLAIGAGYNENNNMVYRTEENVQQFIDFGKRTRETTYAFLQYTHRPSFYSFHNFTLSYRNTTVNDSVAILNPDYFLDGKTQQKRFRFGYRYRKEVRDNISYPLNGYMFNFEADKIGLGIYDDVNQLEFSTEYNKYLNLGKNYYLSFSLGGGISFPKKQPYINSNRFGYKPNILRGYELNVIEGQRYFIHKTSFKKQLLKTEFHFNNLIRKKQFNTIPLAIYLKTFFDGGYVSRNFTEPMPNDLANKYIFGTGVGLDFVTYYDFVMRIEYSINNQGVGGWFLNFRSDLR